jgi:DNA-binding transcriptional ArsR family regulator
MVKYEDRIGSTFLALSDPTRRHVVARLARGPATVSELASEHDLTLPGMMKHLRVLEAADLLRSMKDGRVRRCALSAAPMRTAWRYLDQYRQLWERRFDALAQLLEERKVLEAKKEEKEK